MPLPDERPRQSVANLIGRFEQQGKRNPTPSTSFKATSNPSHSINANANTNGSNGSSKPSDKETTKSAEADVKKETSPSVPTETSLESSKTTRLSRTGVRSPDGKPRTPVRKATATAMATTTPSRSAVRSPVSKPSSFRPQPAAHSAAPIKQQLTGASATSTSTPRKPAVDAASALNKERPQLSAPATPGPTRPKTPSRLYAPTAASLARANQATPPMPKRSSTLNTTSNLTRPTAASVSRVSSPPAKNASNLTRAKTNVTKPSAKAAPVKAIPATKKPPVPKAAAVNAPQTQPVISEAVPSNVTSVPEQLVGSVTRLSVANVQKEIENYDEDFPEEHERHEKVDLVDEPEAAEVHEDYDEQHEQKELEEAQESEELHEQTEPLLEEGVAEIGEHTIQPEIHQEHETETKSTIAVEPETSQENALLDESGEVMEESQVTLDEPEVQEYLGQVQEGVNDETSPHPSQEHESEMHETVIFVAEEPLSHVSDSVTEDVENTTELHLVEAEAQISTPISEKHDTIDTNKESVKAKLATTTDGSDLEDAVRMLEGTSLIAHTSHIENEIEEAEDIPDEY